jgi:uncharacterized protein (TIGR03435 family)
MHDCVDSELLRRYVQKGSEPAFAALVTRHLSLVYSAALRKTGNPHAAEEISQAVFLILAKKANSLLKRTVLTGWLYRATRHAAENYLRTNRRRTLREQDACMQSLSNVTESETWQEIKPLLEDAMGTLGEKDRHAILLRFFEGKSFLEIGTVLQSSENATKKRVAYALAKLQRYFAKRGIASPAAVLAGVIPANSAALLPIELAPSITASVISQGAGTTGSSLTLVKGALKMMAWTKAKAAVTAGVGILLVAGTATVAVERIQAQETYSWQVPQANFDRLHETPPQVVIVPSRFTANGQWVGEGDRTMGIAQPLKQVAICAYSGNWLRTVVEGTLPDGKYDFIANLPRGSGSGKALQAELKKKYGVVGERDNREADVLLLKLKQAPAPGLQPGTHQPQSKKPGRTIAISTAKGKFDAYNQPIGILTANLENDFKIPILDRTGLKGTFDISLSWDESESKIPKLEAMKQAMSEQLGLVLVPARESIEMLIVKQDR